MFICLEWSYSTVYEELILIPKRVELKKLLGLFLSIKVYFRTISLHNNLNKFCAT